MLTLMFLFAVNKIDEIFNHVITSYLRFINDTKSKLSTNTQNNIS